MNLWRANVDLSFKGNHIPKHFLSENSRLCQYVLMDSESHLRQSGSILSMGVII